MNASHFVFEYWEKIVNITEIGWFLNENLGARGAEIFLGLFRKIDSFLKKVHLFFKTYWEICQ